VPTTPTYAFPYPSLSDPPNGAGQIQSLAQAVENKIITVDATDAAQNSSITTINTTLNTLNMRSLGGRIATTAGVINAGITTTEVNITKIQFENSVITSGRIYVFHVTLSFQASAGNDSYQVRVRKDTALSGTIVAAKATITQVSGFTHYLEFHRPWSAPSSDADADFYVSAQRIAGSGSIDVNGNSETCFWIDEIVNPTDWQLVA
jgi:hypothetical protein